jgi:hypothetical protein
MKAVIPGLPIVAGVLAENDTSWLGQAYAAGLKGYYDAISVHPYNVRFDTPATGDPTVPWPTQLSVDSFASGLPWVHNLMQQQGDGNKPIWVTEFGFSDCTAASALCVSDASQATYMAGSYRLLSHLPYVAVALGYNVRDTQNAPSDWNYNFGFVHADWSTKPVFTTLQQTFSCLAAATC